MVDRFDARARTISVMRKVGWAAALLGIYGTFLGLGAQARTVAEYGAAVLLVAVAVRIAAAILDRVPPKVRGVGVVLSASGVPTARTGRCDLELSLSGPGLRPAMETVHEAAVPAAKWPYRGQSLPVMVTLSWPARVRVLWDEVPDHPDRVGADPHLGAADNPTGQVDSIRDWPADELEPLVGGPDPLADEPSAPPPPLRRPRPRPRRPT